MNEAGLPMHWPLGFSSVKGDVFVLCTGRLTLVYWRFTLRLELSLETDEENRLTTHLADHHHNDLFWFRSMSTNNELSKKMNFTSCDDYNEEDPPKRFNFDLRKHFMQVGLFQIVP